MNTSTLEKQLASVAEGRSNIADVRTSRGNLVVLSERLGERFRPLLARSSVASSQCLMANQEFPRNGG